MFLRIGNQDIVVDAANIKWSQNAPAEISIVVAASQVDYRNAHFKDFELWHDGAVIANGYVFDRPSLQLNDAGVLMVTLGCVDDVGRLTCIRALRDAHYQNSQVTSILQDLLSVTTDWILGDTSTMVDTLVKTTIDLRSKEHLWAQIVATLESVPRLFLRYGGYNTVLNKHELEVGNFNHETSRFFQGDNVANIQLQKGSELSYTVVEAYGGKISNRKVTLADALTYPGITLHDYWATYPISYDATRGVYVVIDNTPNKLGCEITKTFNINKTKNDELPTAAEIAEAGFALWLNTVRFLQQNCQYDVFSLSGCQADAPRVCDRAWVQGVVSEPVYDSVTDSFAWHDTFEVLGSYRTTQVSLDYSNSRVRVDPLRVAAASDDGFEYSLEVTSNDYADLIDGELQLYSRLESFDESDDTPALLGLLYQAVVTVTHTTAEAADGACLGGPAKQFSFALPLPPGATQVFYTVLPIVTSNVTYTIVQVPALPGTPLILCVKHNATWPSAANVTISVQYTFN